MSPSKRPFLAAVIPRLAKERCTKRNVLELHERRHPRFFNRKPTIFTRGGDLIGNKLRERHRSLLLRWILKPQHCRQATCRQGSKIGWFIGQLSAYCEKQVIKPKTDAPHQVESCEKIREIFTISVRQHAT